MIQRLIDFLNASPVNFLAVRNVAKVLDNAGYERIDMGDVVNNSEVAGGSTLGNILSASLPLSGVDMGAPMWAMHSIRETANVQDHEYCIKAFTHFYSK